MATHTYTDKKGNKRVISENHLKDAVFLKIELQKAGNGTCNWNTLCRMLRDKNVEAYQCENFRVLVRRFQKGLGKLPSKMKYADMLSETRQRTITHKIGELNVHERSIRKQRLDFGRYKREVTDLAIARGQYLEAASQSIFVNVKEPINKQPYEKNYYGSTRSLVISLTDLHIGSIKDNVFNLKTANRLLRTYLGKIKKFIDIYKPSEVYIANLGDMIEGGYMRNNQGYDIEFHQSRQQAEAIKEVIDFVNSVYNYTNFRDIKLYYTGITGNHDRTNGNKKDNVDGDSFTIVLNAMVEQLSKQLKGFTFLEPKTPSRTQLCIRNKWIKFVHGDLDNLDKETVLAEFSQKDKLNYSMIIGGHKHSMLMKEHCGLIVQSGSIVGNTKYSDKLNVSASRSQIITLIDSLTGELQPIPVSL